MGEEDEREHSPTDESPDRVELPETSKEMGISPQALQETHKDLGMSWQASQDGGISRGEHRHCRGG